MVTYKVDKNFSIDQLLGSPNVTRLYPQFKHVQSIDLNKARI